MKGEKRKFLYDSGTSAYELLTYKEEWENIRSKDSKVKIEKESKEILVLPKSAVIKKSDSYYVFIPKENGEFTPKKIEAKRVSGDKYEILSGLTLDDEVINNSLFLYDADAMTNRLYDETSDEEW